MTRLLLAVMLATLLSPSFAWHMHAEHEEIVAHGHEHGGDEHAATDGAGGAHTSIGHLLGHLPMQMSRFEIPVALAEEVAPPAAASAPPPPAESPPPYRPPLSVDRA